MPCVNRIYSELKNQGLEVLLVDIRESPDLVKRSVQERGYVAPVLIDRSGDVAGKDWAVWGMPTAYIIDRQGRLVGMMIGPRDRSKPEARTFVRALLEVETGR